MITGPSSSNKSSSDVALAVVQFGDATLRLGTFNCGGLGGTTNQNWYTRDKLITYCRNSGCLIVALQESKTDNIGQLWGPDSGYYLHSLGKTRHDDNAKSDEGLAFFIKASVQDPVVQSCGSGIALIRFEFNKVKIAFFNIYAPSCSPAAGYRVASVDMYLRLRTIVAIELKELDQIVVIGGDFNAFPDFANTGKYEPFIGKHVYGSANAHGLILLDFLRATEVFHLNSRFKKDIESKWTLLYKKNGTTKTELDGLISNRTDIVADVDTFPKKNGKDEDELDHRMVFSDWLISKPREEFSKKMRRIEKLIRSWEHYPEIIGSVAENTTESQNWEFLKNLLNAMYVQATTLEIVEPISPEAVEDYLEGFYSVDGGETAQPIQEDPEDSIESLTAKTNYLSLEPISFSEEEIQEELEREVTNCTLGYDQSIKKIIDLGGDLLVKEATELFNDVLSRKRVPEDWKTVLFKLPDQGDTPKSVDEYVFKGTIPWLGCVYSNLLARKLNEAFGGSYDIEKERSEKSAEIIITLTLLIEAFLAAKKTLHFAVIEYPTAYDKVRPSSILESLKEKSVPKQYYDAFSGLLREMSLELKNGSRKIQKKSGLHFGDVANYFLMNSTLEMIVKDCEDKWNREKIVNVPGPNNSEIDVFVEEFSKKVTISTGNESVSIQQERRSSCVVIVSSSPTESSDDFDDSGIQANDSFIDESMNENSEREESYEPRDDGQESQSKPQNEEVSTSETPNTEPRGIKIGDNYLNILHFDNKIILIDTKLEKIETSLDDISVVSQKCGLMMDYQHISLVTTMFSNGTTKLGNNEVKTVDARNFELSYFESKSCKIAEKLCDAAIMRKRFQDIALYVTMPEFISSKTKKEKLNIFKKKLVPSLFYNCKTWISTGEENTTLRNYTDNILFQLGNGNHAFGVWKHVVHEKAAWLKAVARREDTFCAMLLNGWAPGDFTVDLDRVWSGELRSNSVGKLIDKKIEEWELIPFIKEKPEVWDQVIEDMRQV